MARWCLCAVVVFLWCGSVFGGVWRCCGGVVVVLWCGGVVLWWCGGRATGGRHHLGISIRKSSAPGRTQIQGTNIPRTSMNFSVLDGAAPWSSPLRQGGRVEPGSNNFSPPLRPHKSQSEQSRASSAKPSRLPIFPAGQRSGHMRPFCQKHPPSPHLPGPPLKNCRQCETKTSASGAKLTKSPLNCIHNAGSWAR